MSSEVLRPSTATAGSQKSAPEWPDGALDYELLRRSGWQPVPFRQFIFKVHSRCNLACDHCYMYEMADQSWRAQPKRMTGAVVDAALGRIAAHAQRHHLDELFVVIHGGEPLLCGADFLIDFAGMVRQRLGGRDVELVMQTNGVLLDATLARLCRRLNIRVGISIDGDRGAYVRHRRFHGGESSYEQVARAAARLASDEFRDTFAGLLCTVDIANDPVATYEHLISFRPPSIDFLLPHANWSAPPPGKSGGDSASTPYADWLIAIFDRWFLESPQRTSIRIFEDIVTMAMGAPGRSEALGTSPVALLVIETDGAIEQVDSLKSAYEGAPGTGLNVFDHDLDAAFRLPGIMARQIQKEALCTTCRACPVGAVCGGGHYTHRYRAGTGFLNPSVYCTDLLALIAHINARLLGALDERGLLTVI